ncbi:MAG TPA: hypothetical protein VF765_31250 [Polyangiaceae bacterium]
MSPFTTDKSMLEEVRDGLSPLRFAGRRARDFAAKALEVLEVLVNLAEDEVGCTLSAQGYGLRAKLEALDLTIRLAEDEDARLRRHLAGATDFAFPTEDGEGMVYVDQGLLEDDRIEWRTFLSGDVSSRRSFAELGPALAYADELVATPAPRCIQCAHTERHDPEAGCTHYAGGELYREEDACACRVFEPAAPDHDFSLAFEFTCPRCGGNKWGTEGAAADDRKGWMGYCHGLGPGGVMPCGFRWSRSEPAREAKYFTRPRGNP